MNSSAARVVAGVSPTLPVDTRSQSRLQLGTLLAMPNNSKRFHSFRVWNSFGFTDMVSEKPECSFSVFFGNHLIYTSNLVSKASENKDCGYILAMRWPLVCVCCLSFLTFIQTIAPLDNLKCQDDRFNKYWWLNLSTGQNIRSHFLYCGHDGHT